MHVVPLLQSPGRSLSLGWIEFDPQLPEDRGASARYKAGQDITEIMMLGRWQDTTAFRYLRPEMYQAPDQLRKIAAYR